MACMAGCEGWPGGCGVSGSPAQQRAAPGCAASQRAPQGGVYPLLLHFRHTFPLQTLLLRRNLHPASHASVLKSFHANAIQWGHALSLESPLEAAVQSKRRKSQSYQYFHQLRQGSQLAAAQAGATVDRTPLPELAGAVGAFYQLATADILNSRDGLARALEELGFDQVGCLTAQDPRLPSIFLWIHRRLPSNFLMDTALRRGYLICVCCCCCCFGK